MKLAVLADIHGILPALEAVFEDMQQQRISGIIVAGDLIRGPDDNAVIRLLQTIPGWVIRGNTDRGAVRYAAGEAPEWWFDLKQYAAFRWSLEKLEENSLAFLKSLPVQQAATLSGLDTIRVVHGSPRNPDELLYPERDPAALETALKQIEEPVLVCGHTHKSWVFAGAGKLALNPGSVGLSTEGSPHARYAVLHWAGNAWTAEQRLVDYDHDQVRRRFRESGFLVEGGAFARALLCSAVSGQDITMQFIRHARQAAQEAGVTDLDAIPDAVWDRAERMFDWRC